MHPFLNIATKAARKAGEYMVRAMERSKHLQIDEKGPNDFVTEVDRKAEAILIDTIQHAYPGHGILGEESGEIAGDDDIQWIIDPLDGTANYIHGIPHFCISMAVKQHGRIEHGLIYNPISLELYTATRGSGAQLNRYRIRVSPRRDMATAILGTGFPFRQRQQLPTHLNMVADILAEASDIRRAGSAALDLAYVAAGRLDGYWEMGLKCWDIAAGALIVRESGGLVSDIDGSEGYLDSGNIVAGNPKIFKNILQKLHPHIT